MNENDLRKPLGMSKLISYVAGTFGMTLVTGIAGNFIAYYFTDIVGLEPAQEGTVVMLGSFFAIVVCFIFGIILDRTASEKGKGRVWMKRLFIPYIFFGIVLYAIPESLSSMQKFTVSMVVYLICVAITTMFSCSYQAMAPNITRDPKSRGTMSMYNMISSMIIGIFVNSSLLNLVEKMGGGHTGFLYVAIIFAVVGGCFVMYCIATSREIIPTEEEDIKSETKETKRSFVEDIRGLLANKYWVIMTVSGVAFSCWFGSFMGSQSYFAIYVLKDPGKIGMMFSTSTIPGIVSMLVFAPVMARYGRRKVILVTGLCSMAGFLLMIFGVDNFSVFFIGMIVRGFFCGPYQGCEIGLLNNTVEYGEWKNGFRQEGMIASTSSTVKKTFSAIMSGCIGYIMAATGYVAGAEQTATAIFGIKLLYLYLPMIFCIITYVCVFFYRLEDEYPAILEELKKRREQ